MRRVLAPVVPLLAALLALAGTATAGTVTNRVVGGGPATSADAPWQVLVLPDGYLCGGAILDATHVVTAAHCVYDDEDQEIVAPSSLAIHAGITNISTPGQHPPVTAVSVDPAYDPDRQTSDVAILTLGSPLALGGAVQAIALTDVGYRPAAGDGLRLSGWGSDVARSPDDETEPEAVPNLRVVTLHTNDGCASVYSPFDDSKLLCAGSAGLDACQGDSGGPLAVQAGGVWKLAGIVTGGAGCAWPGYPGYYARTSDPDIHAYLAQLGAGYAVQDPVNVSPPQVSGSAVAGGTIACAVGGWQHAYAYGVGFVRADGSLAARGSTMALGAGDVGATLRCVVEAYGLTGTAEAVSAPVVIGAAPVPLGAGPPAPPPALPPAPVDAVAPTARVAKLRCARAVCTLDVRVDDPAPSSGVKALDARVTTTYRTTCVRNHRRRACTKSVEHRLRTVVTGLTTFRVVTPRLRKGTQTFRLVATDARGNRQRKATVLRKTTR